MAKTVVNPEAELPPRDGDIQLTEELLAAVSVFASMKKAPAFAKRRKREASVAVRIRICGLEAAANHRSARCHLLDTGTSRQPADHSQSS